MKKSGQLGFTIVELLIVIVVIGILAAITIVAFNGVQQRANNTAKFEAAATYGRSMQIYVAQNNAYPTMGAGSVCLGKNYTIRGGDTVGSCGGSDYTTKEDSPFNTAIQTVLTSVPNGSNRVVTKESGVTFVGITLTNWSGFTVDGQSNPYVMQFVLEGRDQDCKVAGVVQEVTPGVWGAFTPTTTRNNTFYDAVSTTCVVALPNPS